MALAGRKLARGELDFDPDAAAAAIAKLAEELSGLPVLRIYWYDGTAGGPTRGHIAIAELPSVKLRLGIVNSQGEQKGVDSLIITDMITLARNHAMTDAVLLSGDEDLRVGMQQAQEFGVRVHLVGIEPSRGSQSILLIQEADTVTEWSRDALAPFLRVREAVPQEADAAITELAVEEEGSDLIEAVARSVAALVAREELQALVDQFASSRQVPPDLHRQLLGGCKARMQRMLDAPEKERLRMEFIEACKLRLGQG